MTKPAWRPVSAVVAVALLLTINRYDYHRDELYFRLLGAHPQWGSVDQPPFTPLLVRACVEVFGDTLWAIRLPGVVLIVAAAFLLAFIAREAGGGGARSCDPSALSARRTWARRPSRRQLSSS